MADAQSLRISDDGSDVPPGWATFRLGPFYSAGNFSQSAGARWSDGNGRGTDFLTGTSRGIILDDGWDVPLISRVSLRNYAQLGRYLDLEMTVSAQYEHYPLDTQRDRFLVNLGEEGIYGRIDSQFRITKNMYGLIYWQPRYQTDYVDSRGDADTLAGEEFEYFESIIGSTLTWEFAKGKSVAATLSRTDFLPQESRFDDQERVEHAVQSQYAQQIFPGVNAGIQLEHRDIDYKSPSRRDSTIDTVNLFGNGNFADEAGTRVQLTRNSVLSGSIGYSVGRSDSLRTGDVESQSGETTKSFVWSAAFDWGEVGQLSKNMRHQLGYQRSIDTQFDADLAIVDTVTYNWTWLVGLWDFWFDSVYRLVDPQEGDASEYSDWSNTLGVNYHMTKHWAINAASTYAIRDNDKSVDDTDYEEWVSTVGTGYDLTRSIDFSTSFQHAERDGDGDGVDFERNTFEALLTYTRPF
ncbi:MAG: hypothetical protein O3B84_03525 [Chloroflexi bacterium]|nr:hypothetical protein [Chloroflexota bacterium]